MDDAVSPSDPSRDGLLKSLAVRFATLYFAQWVLPLPLGFATEPFVQALGRALGAGPVPDVSTGSGDRLHDWLEWPAKVLIALVGTALWAVLDRRRRHERLNREVLRTILRYGLAIAGLAYGLAKTSQFPAPTAMQLSTPVGELTPMRLMWIFMGTSLPYAIFGGLLEISGGFLLLFRRTTLLGAVAFAAVMANVVALNLCYGVTVKLYSTHLLLAALILIAPDAGRLWRFFVTNERVAPREFGMPARNPKLRKGVLVAKWLVLGAGIVALVGFTEGMRRDYAGPGGPLSGLWRVRRQTEGRREVSAGEAGRWSAVEFSSSKDGFVVLRADGQPDMRAFAKDDGRGTLSLDVRRGGKRTWRYRIAGGGDLTLEEGPRRIELARDAREWPLAHHAYRLVQEDSGDN